MLRGKNIVVGITGGIAAYKSAFLVRLLVKAGAEVQVIMTPNAKEFITPVTLSTLSGRPVISEFFTANTGEWHSHVDLGLWADAFVVAPATASTLAKMANGVADNMLVTSYLSTRATTFVAPAMDFDMWLHPSTARNLATLKADGVKIVDPESGELASHLTGKGRMAEPETIVKALECYFSSKEDLKGKKVLITAGPTYELIDPVRFIGNFSSGKMGYSIAGECVRRGADVTLVSGPTSLSADPKARRIDVTSAKEMLDAVMKHLGEADIVVFCAAVADYAPEEVSDRKIKRENKDEMVIRLRRNPDISAVCCAERRPGQVFVGFALETDNERDNAISKLRRKGLDWIVLNSLKDKDACFGGDCNKITVFGASGEEYAFPLVSKEECARNLVDIIVMGSK